MQGENCNFLLFVAIEKTLLDNRMHTFLYGVATSQDARGLNRRALVDCPAELAGRNKAEFPELPSRWRMPKPPCAGSRLDAGIACRSPPNPNQAPTTEALRSSWRGPSKGA
jgi:hypothetical protein